MLYDDVGQQCTDEAGMHFIVLSYFTSLFSVSVTLQFDAFLILILVVHSDNNALLSPFTTEEFRLALFEMHPDKALRPTYKCCILSEVLAYYW